MVPIEQVPRTGTPATVTRHFVLTRHALAHGGRPPSADWVLARRELLTRATANSLLHQSTQAFEWLVFVDESMAEEETAYLDKEVGGALGWRVVAVSLEEAREGRAFWARSLGTLREGDRLVTTRLDSDDALHPDFIRTVGQIAATASSPTSIDLVCGAFVDSKVGIPLTRPYKASPFQSLVESVSATSPARTVMWHSHPDLPAHFPYRPVRTPVPMWFVSVHGGNLGNRAYGRPRPAEVVPRHLHEALGVRPSSSFERSRYGLRILADYSARFARPSTAVPAARTLGGHLASLAASGRNSRVSKGGS